MTKRGSQYLRTDIFRAAFIASNYDPVFKAFYEKKKSEGKHHLTCIRAVARKLCYTIRAILSKTSPYEIQSISWLFIVGLFKKIFIFADEFAH